MLRSTICITLRSVTPLRPFPAYRSFSTGMSLKNLCDASLDLYSFAAAEQQDIVVIGGGPGGYVAGIKAGQLGFKVFACLFLLDAHPKIRSL